MFFKTPFFERKHPFSLLSKIKTINNLVDKLENLLEHGVNDPFSNIVGCRERPFLCNSINKNP
jgi:hypothetical protein